MPKRNKLQTLKNLYFYLLLLQIFLNFISYSNTKIINTFSIKQISKTGLFESSWILRQYKLALMARFMEINSANPKLRQDQKAKEIGWSSSILQRYGYDINTLSPLRIPSNSLERRQKISNDNSNSEPHPKKIK